MEIELFVETNSCPHMIKIYSVQPANVLFLHVSSLSSNSLICYHLSYVVNFVITLYLIVFTQQRSTN